MKRRQRLLVIATLVVAAAAVMVWWAIMGAHIFTSTAHLVQVKDELFGTTTDTWVKEFQPGLELCGPIAGALLLTAGAIAYRARKMNARLAKAARRAKGEGHIELQAVA